MITVHRLLSNCPPYSVSLFIDNGSSTLASDVRACTRVQLVSIVHCARKCVQFMLRAPMCESGLAMADLMIASRILVSFCVPCLVFGYQ